jgi:membrane protease YdiL (CAAX protease family)
MTAPARPGVPAEPGTVRVRALLALLAGVLLWYLPTFGEPLVRPIGEAMRATGVLAPGTSTYAADFSAVLVLRWLAVALLLVLVVAVERRPLSSVGVRPVRLRDALLTVAVAVVTLVITVVLYSMVAGVPDGSTQTGRILTALSAAQAVHLIVNAAVVEELFYRGFLMERLIDLTRRPWLAALVSYVVFVGSHAPEAGWAMTLTMVAPATALFVGLYWWRRNVVLCILAHAITDLVVLAGANA